MEELVEWLPQSVHKNHTRKHDGVLVMYLASSLVRMESNITIKTGHSNAESQLYADSVSSRNE